MNIREKVKKLIHLIVFQLVELKQKDREISELKKKPTEVSVKGPFMVHAVPNDFIHNAIIFATLNFSYVAPLCLLCAPFAQEV